MERMKYILRNFDIFGSWKDQYFNTSSELIHFIEVDRTMPKPSIRVGFKVYKCDDVTQKIHVFLDREKDDE